MDRMRPDVMKVLENHDIRSINGERFRDENHEMDNRIIFDFNWILSTQETNRTKIVGYTEHPAVYERDDSVAVMFEYNGREFWCHIPGIKFEPWNIGRLFGIPEMENIDWSWEEMS